MSGPNPAKAIIFAVFAVAMIFFAIASVAYGWTISP